MIQLPKMSTILKTGLKNNGLERRIRLGER